MPCHRCCTIIAPFKNQNNLDIDFSVSYYSQQHIIFRRCLWPAFRFCAESAVLSAYETRKHLSKTGSSAATDEHKCGLEPGSAKWLIEGLFGSRPGAKVEGPKVHPVTLCFQLTHPMLTVESGALLAQMSQLLMKTKNQFNVSLVLNVS